MWMARKAPTANTPYIARVRGGGSNVRRVVMAISFSKGEEWERKESHHFFCPFIAWCGDSNIELNDLIGWFCLSKKPIVPPFTFQLWCSVLIIVQTNHTCHLRSHSNLWFAFIYVQGSRQMDSRTLLKLLETDGPRKCKRQKRENWTPHFFWSQGESETQSVMTAGFVPLIHHTREDPFGLICSEAALLPLISLFSDGGISVHLCTLSSGLMYESKWKLYSAFNEHQCKGWCSNFKPRFSGPEHPSLPGRSRNAEDSTKVRIRFSKSTLSLISYMLRRFTGRSATLNRLFLIAKLAGARKHGEAIPVLVTQWYIMQHWSTCFTLLSVVQCWKGISFGVRAFSSFHSSSAQGVGPWLFMCTKDIRSIEWMITQNSHSGFISLLFKVHLHNHSMSLAFSGWQTQRTEKKSCQIYKLRYVQKGRAILHGKCSFFLDMNFLVKWMYNSIPNFTLKKVCSLSTEWCYLCQNSSNEQPSLVDLQWVALLYFV